MIHKKSLPYLLCLPAVLLMTLFMLGPVLAVLFLSFTDWQLGASSLRLVGLENYKEVLNEPLLVRSIYNTALYLLMTVIPTTALGLAAASAVLRTGKWRSIYQTVYFLPFMGTAVAMLIVWEFMLHPSVGLWGDVAGFFGVDPFYILRNENTALPMLAAISVWQNMGFGILLFMAGLSGVPAELYEAAVLDGASSPWARFRLVTWPMIGHVTFFVLVLLTVRSLQVFESVAVLTKGGPNDATEVLTYSIYKEGFEFFRTNIASALTVIFLSAIGVLLLLKARAMQKRVHYQ